jgi:hypothetical protein
MYLLDNVNLDLIVNEMINIESGELRYIDEDPEEPPYESYPLLQQKGMEIALRTQRGTIYVNMTKREREDLAYKIRRKLQSTDQSWFKTMCVHPHASNFIHVYRQADHIKTSIRESAAQRHISVSITGKFAHGGKNTIFTWYILPLRTLHDKLEHKPDRLSKKDLFTIVCHDNTINLNGYYPGSLTHNNLIINNNLIKTYHHIRYSPDYKFWINLYGKRNFPYRDYTTVPGDDVGLKVCMICRKHGYNRVYSDPDGNYVCEICFHHNDCGGFTQHHVVDTPLYLISEALAPYRVAESDSPLLKILLSFQNEEITERTFIYKTNTYTIVECGEYCCIDMSDTLEVIGMPKFTDKKIIMMIMC